MKFSAIDYEQLNMVQSATQKHIWIYKKIYIKVELNTKTII